MDGLQVPTATQTDNQIIWKTKILVYRTYFDKNHFDYNLIILLGDRVTGFDDDFK